MQIIKSSEDIKSLKNNKIIGAENLALNNSEIRFGGEGNILFCEKGVKLVNSQLKFFGNNCVIYLCENKHDYILDVSVYNSSSFFMGKNNYINGVLHAVLSERKNIVIGSGNLFSFGIWIRTADPHLVYSADTKKRINPSKSVYIGDHVWIGQGALVLKGTKLHSGCILGGGAVCAGKEVPSNTSWGGNPAKQLSSGIFWDYPCVHGWKEEDTESHQTFKSDSYIYKEDSKTVAFDITDKSLDGAKSADEKLEILSKTAQNTDKNRFSLDFTDTKKKGFFKR